MLLTKLQVPEYVQTVSEGSPQTICQNLDNLKPENNSKSIESKIFTFDAVPVKASFHSCIQRLISPNITLCDNYESKNSKGPTIEQIMLPFFGVNPTDAQDDEGYTICPENLTEVPCYGKIVRTPDDGYDVNDTSIDQANKSISTIEVSSQQPGQNQTYSSEAASSVYYEGLDWWGICNNSLVRSYISQPCDTLVTPESSRAHTSRESSIRKNTVSKRSTYPFYSRVVLWDNTR